MAAKKYCVALSRQERDRIKELLRKRTTPARTVTRARVILLADEGKTDWEISEKLACALTTPRDIRQRCGEGGLDRALYDAPRSGQPLKLNGHEAAQVVAIACTTPPEGRKRWTLDLLTDKVRGEVKEVGRSTIHRVLLRNELKPWREKNVVHSRDYPRVRAEDDGRAGGL